MRNTRTGALLATRLATAFVLASGLLAGCTAALADAHQLRLNVSATVLKRASLKVVTQPSAVLVTEADIERGYVDVAGPAQVTVRNNSVSGYLLVFANQGEFLRQVRVRGLGGEVQMGADGGFVRQPGGAVASSILDLGFRFELAPTARAGVYAWPVQLSAVPL